MKIGKAKALVGNYRLEQGYTVLRVYLESSFDLAEADLKMIQSTDTSKEWKLVDCEAVADETRLTHYEDDDKPF